MNGSIDDFGNSMPEHRITLHVRKGYWDGEKRTIPQPVTLDIRGKKLDEIASEVAALFGLERYPKGYKWVLMTLNDNEQGFRVMTPISLNSSDIYLLFDWL